LVHFVHHAAMTAGRHLQVQAPQYSDCEIVESVERLLSEKKCYFTINKCKVVRSNEMTASQNYTHNSSKLHSALYIKMLPFKITTTVTTLFIRPKCLSIQFNSFSVDK